MVTNGKESGMAEVRLEGVRKTYGDFVAVHDLHMAVRPGEFLSLLGASGSGKTTCLRMVAGFVEPSAGHVYIDGEDVTALPPYRRNTGMVFQSYALFPHMTVAENVAFGLKVRRFARAEAEHRTREALRLVQLDHLAARYPAQLSGGQKQRVALARAIVIEPKVLLLDEPLAALDLKLREELQVELKRIQNRVGVTTLFVTHDQGEALSMSDRVAVMRDGRIVQLDTPNNLYERPCSRYVANFVGRINLLDVIVQDRPRADVLHVIPRNRKGAAFMVTGPQSEDFKVGERCLLATRPERLMLGSDHRNGLSAVVLGHVYRGNSTVVELQALHDDTALTAALPPGGAVPTRGETVRVGWHGEGCFLLKDEPEHTVPVAV